LERLLGCFGEVIVGLIWRVILPLFLKLIWRVILSNLGAYLELFWSIFLGQIWSLFLGQIWSLFSRYVNYALTPLKNVVFFYKKSIVVFNFSPRL
jgi:hypothetical protein